MRSSLEWVPARVERIVDLTPTVREFHVRPEGGVMPVTPGSHLQVQVLVGGRVSTRSYSLTSAGDDGLYRIAVKLLEQGRGGSRAMWQLAEGDRLSVTAPQNHFGLSLSAPAYLLIAGGIGVTPLVLMAQTLARQRWPVRMLYGARSPQELAFVDELRQALGGGLVTAAASQGQSLDWASEIAALAPGGQAYVCGPVPMLDAVRRAWAAAGRAAADLRYETFGSSGRFAPEAFGVRVHPQGLEIAVPADMSLLESLEAAGVAALHDCRRGECGLCVMEVLSLDGEIDHRDVFLSEHEKAANKRLCVCVSRIRGRATLDCAYRPEAGSTPAP